MIDNLRRTLVDAGGVSHAGGRVGVAGVVARCCGRHSCWWSSPIPPLLPAFAGVWPHVPGISKRSHLRAVARDFRSAVAQMALTLTTMAHQAWLMTDAIGADAWPDFT